MLPGADLGTGLLDCSTEEDEEAQQLRTLDQTSLKLKTILLPLPLPSDCWNCRYPLAYLTLHWFL